MLIDSLKTTSLRLNSLTINIRLKQSLQDSIHMFLKVSSMINPLNFQNLSLICLNTYQLLHQEVFLKRSNMVKRKLILFLKFTTQETVYLEQFPVLFLKNMFLFIWLMTISHKQMMNMLNKTEIPLQKKNQNQLFSQKLSKRKPLCKNQNQITLSQLMIWLKE